MDVLTVKRHEESHTFLAQVLKAVLLLGAEGPITADMIRLLRTEFETVCLISWEKAYESKTTICDRSAEYRVWLQQQESALKKIEREKKRREEKSAGRVVARAQGLARQEEISAAREEKQSSRRATTMTKEGGRRCSKRHE